MSAIHQTLRKARPGLVALNAASTIIDAHEANIMITIDLHPGSRENWLAMAHGLRVACVEDDLMEARHNLGSIFVTRFTPIRFAGQWLADQVVNLHDPHRS